MKNTINSSPISASHKAEYSVIKRDLLHVVIINLLLLAGVLVLYFANRNSGFLERWLGSVFHF